MLRNAVRVVCIVALLVGMTGGLALAAELEKPTASASAALPFLAGEEPGCAAATTEVTPALAKSVPIWASTSPTPDICTGCSGHNCYFQTVGTRCFVNGVRGLCTEQPQICPEIKEVTCYCVVP